MKIFKNTLVAAMSAFIVLPCHATENNLKLNCDELTKSQCSQDFYSSPRNIGNADESSAEDLKKGILFLNLYISTYPKYQEMTFDLSNAYYYIKRAAEYSSNEEANLTFCQLRENIKLYLPHYKF